MKKTILLSLLSILILGSALYKGIPFLLPEQNVVPIGGPFELVDSTGVFVSDKTLKGEYLLVYFGYTFCPDICPTSLENITKALNLLSPKALSKVVPLFITLDPKRDTAEFLERYKKAYHPKIRFLRGTDAQIEVAKKAYRAYGERVEVVKGAAEYLIDHTSMIYFMDQNNHFIMHFPHGTDPKIMAEKIETMLR